MTVHSRMVLGLALLTLLTLGGAFAVISFVIDEYQERQLDDALLLTARMEAAEAPANRFTFSSRPGPAANDVGPLEKYGIIYHEDGTVLAATHPFDKQPPPLWELEQAPGRAFDFSFLARRYRGLVVPIPGFAGKRVLLAASREDLDGDSRFLRQAMATALGVSTAWLLVATTWLVRRSMREHLRIAETLRRVASGDFDARVSSQVTDRELQRVGTDIDEIAERLATLIGQQRRFIAHAAHELRSPLAALHGEIQHALRKERSPDEYRASLAFLLKASSRLRQLANELLELARAEQRTETTAVVSAADVVSDAVDALKPLATARSVTMTSRVATGTMVQAFASDLGRILRNLVDNAIRHSPEGGVVELKVEVAERVRFHVIDQGAGVAEAERERIFEPFYRASGTRADRHGAGLGLAIARELARRHDGDVVVAPDGHSFVLSLHGWASSAGESALPAPR